MRSRNKYGARKVVVDGIKHDSKREWVRYGQLLQLWKAGKISDLERQVTYVLAPSVKIEGEKRARPALRYKADFRYFNEAGEMVVEDAKGFPDTAFRIRQHLMKAVHNIDVVLS